MIKRYIEQISGEFQIVKKDVDIDRAPVNETKPVEKYTPDSEIFEAQQQWVNRLNGFYMNILGCLAGMSVMHLIVIFGIFDTAKFLDIYCRFAKNINLVFLIFANVAVILCLAITLIYQQRLSDMRKLLSDHADKFQRAYTISSLITMLLFVSWALLFYLPNYSNQMYYKDPKAIKAGSVTTFKILYLVAHVCYLVGWCLSSSISEAADDICLEPDYDEYNGVDLHEEDGTTADN